MAWLSLAAILLLAPIVLAIIALVKTGNLQSRIWRLEQQIGDLKAHINRLQTAGAQPLEPAEAPKEAVPQAAEPEATVKSTPEEASPEEEDEEAPREEAEEKEEAETQAAPQPEPDLETPPIAARSGGAAQVEKNLTSRWFVWIGAIAIALAGLFLVKYMIDQGVLTPAVRIILALMLGIALTAAGEWLRKRNLALLSEADGPDYVSMALTASGLFTLYAAIYAAFALYNMIGPLTAFVLLGAISLAAFALSALAGVFVALLGLLGGMVTPMLIPSKDPSALGLFAYLATIVAASAAVVHFRPWWPVAIGAVGGAGIWVLLWIATSYGAGDIIIIGLFLAGLAAVFGLLVGERKEGVLLPMTIARHNGGNLEVAGWAAGGVAAGGMALATLVEKFTTTGMVMLAIVAAVASGVAFARTRFEYWFAGAAVLVIAVFAVASGLIGAHTLIPLADILGPGSVIVIQDIDFGNLTKWAVFFAIAFAAAGYFVMRTRLHPEMWAAVSAGVPVALLAVLYGAWYDQFHYSRFAIFGILIGTAALVPTWRLITERSASGKFDLPLGIYALAVLAALSLTMVVMLEDAWLTVALSLQLPAIAWISLQLNIPALRKAAEVICVVLLARLALNPFLVDYHDTHFLGQHWILYGYGVPMLAAHFAGVWFKEQIDDRLVMMLEGIRNVFAVFLVSGEIHIFASGSLTSSRFTFLEGAMQATAWLTMAFARLQAWTKHGRNVDLWTGWVLTALGVGVTVLSSLMFNNPVLVSANVGSWPVINYMLIAYVAPAVLVWFILQLRPRPWPDYFEFAGQVAILGLALVYVTLSVRHIFQGNYKMHLPYLGDAETYTYSAVWIVFAVVLLLAGLARKKALVRYGGLAVLALAVIKVFLSDMAGLEGLWRVASFLGLGLSLVGIGWLYQRFLGSEPEKTAKDAAQ